MGNTSRMMAPKCRRAKGKDGRFSMTVSVQTWKYHPPRKGSAVGHIEARKRASFVLCGLLLSSGRHGAIAVGVQGSELRSRRMLGQTKMAKMVFTSTN